MIERGILEKARAETRVRIGGFIGDLTGKFTRVVFDETSELALPPSCQPDPPLGWAKDDEGNWQRS